MVAQRSQIGPKNRAVQHSCFRPGQTELRGLFFGPMAGKGVTGPRLERQLFMGLNYIRLVVNSALLGSKWANKRVLGLLGWENN